MHLKGEELSAQARQTLNQELLHWLRVNHEDIDETCLIAELFRGTRKTPGIRVLREQLQKCLGALRVRRRQEPGQCEIHGRAIVECAPERGPWKPLSATMLAAVLGMDHSSFVKRKVKPK